ncbi:MAG: D-alanine--D-alanine ligase [Clostridia bacterium]|nr:D-alanine--D-alanine ligase [Clostridia bacterium]
MKIKLAVLFGGRSVEHEVSVISALQAMENLNADKYEIIPVYISKNGEMFTGEFLRDSDEYKNIPELLKKSIAVNFVLRDGKTVLVRKNPKKFGNNDITEVEVAFPIVHGTNVEDGTLQGFLRTVGLPFVGCDVLASAVGMDKYVMKAMLKDGGFPVLDCVRLRRSAYVDRDTCIEKIEAKLQYPVIVKPVNLGSSVGISKASDRDGLYKSLDEAFTYADTVIVEKAVVELREINCSVVGDVDNAEASECEEPFMCDEILSYKDKYMGGGKGTKGGSKGMASLQRKVPADLTPEMREKIRTLAVDAFKHLGCAGVSRVDFMIDNADGSLYINEFNTIPGSLAFYLWKPLGVEYRELLDRLISIALKRNRNESEITYSFDSNILSMGIGKGSKGSKGAKS